MFIALRQGSRVDRTAFSWLYCRQFPFRPPVWKIRIICTRLASRRFRYIESVLTQSHGVGCHHSVQQPQQSSQSVAYSDFLERVQSGRIAQVTIQGQDLTATTVDGQKFYVFVPRDDNLVPTLLKNKVDVKAEPAENQPWYITMLISWLPMLILIGLWFFFVRQMGGGTGSRTMSFGKSRAKLLNQNEKQRVTFADVAGVDEAKEELVEVVEFLSNPKKFTRLGGRIPKGVLLVGPPGTGKTLLARAVAGEAGVPFFSMSGSDFVEMFVGVGASRVRDLFEQGKKNAPCIIFIDEIDAVGRHRGAGIGGGNDEREQTLNQMLVEMDGFEANEGVIIIAATNRPDVLDPALLRPGRFDRQVVVPTPDRPGRKQILVIHSKKTPLARDVNLDVIAAGTPGFSGADLENLVNEAALQAARTGRDLVDMNDFEYAKDKIVMGRERRSLILSDEEQRITAYHEGGHALCAKLLPGSDPVHKVSIIPRGQALGVTMQLPEEDRYGYSRDFLRDNMVIMLGGRVAEEIIFGDVTTGRPLAPLPWARPARRSSSAANGYRTRTTARKQPSWLTRKSKSSSTRPTPAVTSFCPTTLTPCTA